MRVFHGILLTIGGCQAPSVVDFRPVDTPRAVDALTDVVLSGTVGGVVAVDGFELVGDVDGALVRVDPRLATPRTLRAVGPQVWDATTLADGSLLLATDDGLWVSATYLQDSPVQAWLTSPAVQVGRVGGAVWLRSESGLSLWRGGALSTLDWQDEPLSAPFAVGGREQDIPVVWSGGARGLVALGETTSGWQPLVELDDARPSSIGVDATGLMVAVTSDGLVVRRDGVWQGWTTLLTSLRVLANPAAVGVWLVGDDALWWTDGEHVEALTGLPGSVALPDAARSVDAAGRLLVAADDVLLRVVRAPTVVVVGVRDHAAIEGETVVSAQVTPTEGLSSVTMTVDDAPLPVTDGEATLDPFAFLDDASHEVRATATWTDGRTGDGTLSFTVAAVGAATWTDNVEPLFQARCAKCHAGSTQTRLDSADAWRSHIQLILDDVTQRRMPLGGPALSGGEISVIRAWQEAGFP